LLLGTAIPAVAWIPAAAASSGISISIGLHHAGYPELVLVPGYPVYYAPQLPANYFFYDGYYWLYHDDHWYTSDWYDGPWTAVDPDDVPLFVLRVPVRYYVSPPLHFHGWYAGRVTAPAGTTGTAASFTPPRRCRCTSATTAVTVIRAASTGR
jgi:hypothetical protein